MQIFAISLGIKRPTYRWGMALKHLRLQASLDFGVTPLQLAADMGHEQVLQCPGGASLGRCP